MTQWNPIKTSTAFYSRNNNNNNKVVNVYETMKDPKQPKQSEKEKQTWRHYTSIVQNNL